MRTLILHTCIGRPLGSGRKNKLNKTKQNKTKQNKTKKTKTKTKQKTNKQTKDLANAGQNKVNEMNTLIISFFRAYLSAQAICWHPRVDRGLGIEKHNCLNILNSVTFISPPFC